ncbi:CDP-alcohol phosphatidyltransferase family protein [Caenispirillum salinarum]|uniref:CDP-alcohol phosphatidyltransferase family protein n=1 Tax=Caenispirillum salinarum TaxID=859058 RepID=UPI00384FACA1
MRPQRAIVKQLPNLLTIFRLLMVPVVVELILEGRLAWAFWVFVLAGVTDAVDGILARVLDARSKLGGFLDPLADKALLVSVFVALGWSGVLPSWIVTLVVFRDVLIVGGAILYEMVVGGLHMRPLLVSKANTVAQVALGAGTLAVEGLNLDVGPLVGVLTFAAAATTIASGAAYLWVWGRHALEATHEGDDR